MKISADRYRSLNKADTRVGPVVYWMQRDQRAQDNWALLYAQEKALERNEQLVVVFNLLTDFGGASFRQYDFMLRGLEKTVEELNKRNIPFVLLEGDATQTIPEFVQKYSIGELVVDFNPLRFVANWKKSVAESIDIQMTEVDAHNIIPCWVASEKQEYAAYTFRPKVHRKLKQYLTDFPSLKKQSLSGGVESVPINWGELRKNIKADRSVAPVEWLTPGTLAAKKHAQRFISDRLDDYSELRNDPTKEALSDISPYLHFGQLSAQWLAQEIDAATGYSRESRNVYLEEVVVRRELSDNFCYYNEQYDKVEGAHDWAQKTIEQHKNDEREHVYQGKELEEAATHDELWNATQRQMVLTGKMHGWCRMYWAKKILEWSENTQMAIDRALYLNDKYELDGNDPNGVVGVMWSICGVHDRAWNERPVFGKIRYMNFNGAKRKFDVQAYIDMYPADKKLFNE